MSYNDNAYPGIALIIGTIFVLAVVHLLFTRIFTSIFKRDTTEETRNESEIASMLSNPAGSVEIDLLQEEIKEKAKFISLLPRNTDKQVIAKHRRTLFEKVEKSELMKETVLREHLVRKHKEMHPPIMDDCPICLESIPITSLKSVQYFICCGNMCCFKCIESSVEGGVVRMRKCPLCRDDLFDIESFGRGPGLIKQRAQDGRAWAQAQIGIYYLEGPSCEHGDTGFTVDKAEALKWFKLAAEQRHPDALRNLALMHYGDLGMGNLVEQNYTKARDLFKKAADLGNVQAQISLCIMYRLGQGGPEDKAKAAYYYTLAYESSQDPHPYVCFFLGLYYFRGHGGFDKNLYRAKYYLEEAAERGGTDEMRADVHTYIAACLMELCEAQHNGANDIPGFCPIPRALACYRKAAAGGDKFAKGMIEQFQDQLQQKCANCKRNADSLPGKMKQCGKCKSMWYCGKDCQVEHWNAGHKIDCVKHKG